MEHDQVALEDLGRALGLERHLESDLVLFHPEIVGGNQFLDVYQASNAKTTNEQH